MTNEKRTTVENSSLPSAAPLMVTTELSGIC
eukprot:COSAG01_NODE_75562_length_195_cov_17.906250_1_plen_30_part_10